MDTDKDNLAELTAAKLAGRTMTCLWCMGRGGIDADHDDDCPSCCGRGWHIKQTSEEMADAIRQR